jgi:hypothetical protein
MKLFRLASALACIATGASAQAILPLSTGDKLKFHVRETVSLGFVAETATYAAVLHGMNTPEEWGQDADAYGKRVASAAGATAIRNVFAFSLDAALHEDPRYRRSSGGGFVGRVGHAVKETFVTRTDSGRRRFATWRFGSAIGAAYLSNLWYPDRLQTARSGLEQGAATIGLDVLANLGTEFWPDVKRKILRRR